MDFHSVCGFISSRQHPTLTITILVRHIPSWVPYLSFKPVAKVGRTITREMLYEPMRFAKESIVSNDPGTIVISTKNNIWQIRGTARPSLALENLQEIEKLSESDRDKAEKTLAGALGSIYIG